MRPYIKKNFLTCGLLIAAAFVMTGFLFFNTGDHPADQHESGHDRLKAEVRAESEPYHADRKAVSARADTVVIRSEGADLSYDVTKIEAVAGEELTIKYVNASDMPHNIVLVGNRSDIMPVGTAAIRAPDTDYIPQGELDRILAYTELVRPGETAFLTFTVPPPGTYPYICTYPGHFTLMQGELISTE